MASSNLPKARRILSTLLGLVIVGVVIGIIWKLTDKPVEAAWFDDNWSYRKVITFSNSGSAVTNQKVLLELNTSTLVSAGTIQSACQDARFTDGNGNLLLYYHNSAGGGGIGCNDSSSDFYVLMPSIPTGGSSSSDNIIIYFYYGNPTAPAGTQAVNFSETTFSPNHGPTVGSEVQGVGPISYWRLDEGTGSSASDATAQANTLTVTNAVWKDESFCVSGKCLFFDGNADRASKTYSSDTELLPGTASFTIATWAKNTSPAGSSQVLISRVDGVNGVGWKLYFNASGNLCFGIDQTAGSFPVDAACSTAAYDDSKWHYVVGVKTGTTKITLYVDGIVVAEDVSITGTTLNGSSATFTVGNDFDNGSTGWIGFIDGVRYYNFAQSSAQISANYTNRGQVKGTSASFTPDSNKQLTDNLIGYWKLDETTWSTPDCSTAQVADSSGRSLTGIACPATTGPTGGVTGRFGNSVLFDNSDDRINLGNNYNLSSFNLTISAWVNRTASSDSDVILAKKDGGSDNQGGYMLQLTNTGRLELYLSDATNQVVITSPTSVVPNGVWTHVAATFDRNSLDNTQLFVNGTRLNYTVAGTFSSLGSITTSRPLTIGSNSSPSTPFNGSIDDVRLYFRNLSATEISLLANWTPVPLGYWKLDESSGISTISDSSGSSYAGTLTGFTPTSWSNGKYGSSLRFDGTSTYITMGSEDSALSRDNYTYSAWVYRTTDSGAAEILMDNRDGSNDGQLMQISSSDKFECYYNSTSSVSATSVALNTWYHISCVSSGTTQELFVNGIKEDSDSLSGSISETTDLRIGSVASSPGSYFAGLMDDIKVYNYSRTTKQITEDLNAGHPAGGSPVASQLGYWKLDEQQGQTLNNSGSATITAVVGADSSVTSTDPTWKQFGTQNCKINGCQDFDASDDVDTVTNTTAIDLNDGLSNGLSISAWINPDTLGEGSGGMIFSKGANTYCQLSGSTPFTLTCSLDLSTDATVALPSLLPASTWTHVVLTWTDDNDDEISIYVNGIFRGNSTDGAGPTSADTSNLLIGNNSGGSATFDGRIDEFKIYSSELSVDEIRIDINAGTNAALGGILGTQNNAGSGGTGPVAEWNFDQGSGFSVTDTSGNGNSATFYEDQTASANGPTWTGGKTGGGVNIPGTNDVIRATETSSTDLGATSTSYSVSAWFKTTSTFGATVCVVCKWASGSGAYPLFIGPDNAGNVSFSVSDGGTTSAISSSGVALSLANGQWHHIVGVRNAVTDRLNIYIDGILTGSTTDNTSNASNNADVSFGNGGDSYNSRDFIGQIDNVKIFNYALDASQINWEFGRGMPLGWWKLDECQGAVANDSGNYANKVNGTVTVGASGTHTTAGTCDSGSASEAWDDGVTGKRNYSLDLDGTDDFVNMGDVSYYDFNSMDFSAAGWFNRETFTTDDGLIGKRATTADGAQGWLAYISGSTDKITVETCNANADCFEYQMESTSTFLSSGWNHFVFVWDHDSEYGSTIYVNGKKELVTRSGDPFASSVGNFSSARNLRLGSDHGNTMPFAGEIDDMMIFGYTLNDQQVKALYANGPGNVVNFGPATGAP